MNHVIEVRSRPDTVETFSISSKLSSDGETLFFYEPSGAINYTRPMKQISQIAVVEYEFRANSSI